MGLTVLIANNRMDWPGGTVIYTRDLALELRRQGHRPIVYTWIKGETAKQLEAAGVSVVDDLRRVPAPPDVIQGHQGALLAGALLAFPDVAAVFVCHAHGGAWDRAVIAPQVRRYLGVSALCIDRLRRDGAPAHRTRLSLNSVDLDVFRRRPPLPERPRNALVFSNYASQATHLAVVQEACLRAGVQVDVVGRAAGTTTYHPEELLPRYDVVFAKAKAAMEAMAVGTAVVLCDFGGVGPMVTSADFERLRPLNFGFASLTDSLTPDNVLRQLQRYDAAEAARVCTLMRGCGGLSDSVTKMVAVYREAIIEAKDATTAKAPPPSRWARARYRIVSTIIVLYCRRFGMETRRLPAPMRPLYGLARSALSRLR